MSNEEIYQEVVKSLEVVLLNLQQLAQRVDAAVEGLGQTVQEIKGRPYMDISDLDHLPSVVHREGRLIAGDLDRAADRLEDLVWGGI